MSCQIAKTELWKIMIWLSDTKCCHLAILYVLPKCLSGPNLHYRFMKNCIHTSLLGSLIYCILAANKYSLKKYCNSFFMLMHDPLFALVLVLAISGFSQPCLNLHSVVIIKWSRKNHFEIPRWPSELLLPSAKKSAQKGWIGLSG